MHSSAFRRLVYKTQVFLNHEGDLFRTRLTHSLEVAQLARSIARTLRLNEDLVEAIALAHDLGHTPFGHAGQDALNGCLKALGPQGDDPATAVVVGFEHNLQSLRVVDRLEERYPSFDGLNLTFETREGILKHCSRADAERLALVDATGVAQRFLEGGSPSLEAQLCNLADEIAYNAHDIDDGVRSGLLTLEQMAEVPLFERFRQQALQAHPQLAGRRLLFESIRLMLSQQVYDVIDTTRERIAASGVQTRGRCAGAQAIGGVFRRHARRIHRAQALSVSQSLPPPASDGNHRTRGRGGERPVCFSDGAPRRNRRRARVHIEPAPRGGRLHRRHDRPLRHPRARAPLRHGVVPMRDIAL